jgi:hypothetical protein
VRSRDASRAIRRDARRGAHTTRDALVTTHVIARSYTRDEKILAKVERTRYQPHPLAEYCFLIHGLR